MQLCLSSCRSSICNRWQLRQKRLYAKVNRHIIPGAVGTGNAPRTRWWMKCADCVWLKSLLLVNRCAAFRPFVGIYWSVKLSCNRRAESTRSDSRTKEQLINWVQINKPRSRTSSVFVMFVNVISSCGMTRRLVKQSHQHNNVTKQADAKNRCIDQKRVGWNWI